MFSVNDGRHLSHLVDPNSSGLQARVRVGGDEYGGPFGRPDQGSSLTLLSILQACFRHRIRLLFVGGLVMAGAVVSISLMPKRYEASMQLVVLNARENSVISADAEAPSRAMEQITDTDVNSEAELLRSRDVLTGALDKLGPPRSPDVVRDKAIDQLSRKLDTAAVRQSAVLNVSYVDSSPKLAAQVLQAVASSFVEKELSLRRPAGSRQVFQGLIEASRTDLTMAEARLASFKVMTGIASLNEDETSLIRQLEGTSVQSAALSAEIAASRRRAERTQSEIAKHPERISTQTRVTPNQKAVEDLVTKLVDLENQRTQLVARYQPGEPNVVEVEKQIVTVQSEIARQQSAGALETTTDINPLRQDLESDLAKTQITGDTLVARRTVIEAESAGYSQKLDTLERETAEYESLKRGVSEAQQKFDLAVQKRDKADFDDALDREQILNIAFAARPSASSIPIAPKPKAYLAFALFSALFLGIGSCVVTELGRTVVYSPAELEAAAGVMTLATLPLQTRASRSLRSSAEATKVDSVSANIRKQSLTGLDGDAFRGEQF